MGIEPKPPGVTEMLAAPKTGDLLCFDGIEWKVARRDGWHYPVDDLRLDATGWAEAAFDVPRKAWTFGLPGGCHIPGGLETTDMVLARHWENSGLEVNYE